MLNWEDNKIEVVAHVIPRFMWMTASLDVYLDDRCILQSKGQLKTNGALSGEFEHHGQIHTVDLAWQKPTARHYPYTLMIDDEKLQESKAYIRGWFMPYLVGFAVSTALYYITSHF